MEFSLDLNPLIAKVDSVSSLIQFLSHDTAQIGFDVLSFDCPAQGVVDQCLISALPRKGFEVRHDSAYQA